MLPRDSRKQTGGRGGRNIKPERSSSRSNVQHTRSSGNAPVMGTVIGFAPASASTAPVVNKRFLFAFQVLIGYTVEVEVKSGAVYQGIFHTAQLDNANIHMVLQMAKLIKEGEQQAAAETLPRRPIKELIIKSADLVSLFAKDVRMGANDLSGPAEDTFGTDAAISRGRGGLAGRELQRWAPESSDELSGMLLEPGPAHKGNSSAKWDQFAANKQLFGTQTHYDEDLYTTKLDAGASGISVQEAERLAAEIQGRVASNRHQAEERGAHIDDSGIDEEDLYSAVRRDPSSAEPDEHGQEDDALNADTFGAAAAGNLDAGNGGAAPQSAWSSAGASLAVVGGNNRGENQGAGSSSSKGSATQPIDMSMRAEHNKVRSHLTGSKKERSSPYGTPVTKSPLSTSPLIANAAALEALNLNPGSAKFDSGTLKNFQEWKLQQASMKAAQQRSPPSGVSASPSDTSVLDQADPTREADNDVFASGTPSKRSPGSSTSPTAASTPLAAAAAAAPAASKETAAAAVAEKPASTTTAGAAAAAAEPSKAESAGTSGAAATQTATTPSAAVPKSKLNPFAREFKLNVNAPSFTPGSKPPQVQSSAASTAGGHGSSPAPAARTSQPSGDQRQQPGAAVTPAPASSSGEERQSRPLSAAHPGHRGAHSRPASSPQGRNRGLSPASSGHLGPSRRQHMPSSEHMWAQSQGMHMADSRPNAHMGVPGGMPMQMSGGYMVQGMMPGMMPGMPIMSAGSPDQIIGYMPNQMRPYSHQAYGMVPSQYHNGMMYGEHMNQPGPNGRPPMYSHGYQAPVHSGMQQVPLNRPVSGSLHRSGSAGLAHLSHPGGTQR